MTRSILSFRFLFLTALLLGFAACVDHEFDEPPVGDLTDLEANATIDDLKALHTLGAEPTLITEALLIEGVVAADDRSGNFFRQIAIQDASGGVILRLNATGLFNDFPVGTRLVVDCQGLYIGDYNNLYQLSGSPDSGIEENLIAEHVFVAEQGLSVEPTIVSIDALQDLATLENLLATLIRFENVQFIDANTEVPYADIANRQSVNLTLTDCNGNEIIVRTSGYADFANELSPAGNGNLTAILTIFGDTRQLVLRDPGDLQMTGERCSTGATGGELINISDLRTAFAGGSTSAPDNSKIRGVVISDDNAGNFDGRNLFIQDGTAGIVIRFADFHNFSLGDEIEVTVTAQELSEFNGLLQVSGVPVSSAGLIGPAGQPNPRTTTVSELLANAETWEATLVRLNEVTLSGSSTFDGSITVTDGTGTISMFTRSGANFSGSALPGGPVDLIAIVSQFNDPQIVIRNLDDVIGEGGNNGGGDPEATTALALRTAFAEGATLAPAGKKIRGIVISDKDNGNTTSRNLVLQDTSGGIVLRFTADHEFALGEEIEVIVSNQELSEYNGLLQVNNVPINQAVSFGNGSLPAPREVTVDELLANMNGDQSWESTLVLIKGAGISGSDTYSGTLSVTDGSGSIALYTRSQASFSGNAVPSGTVDITAIVSEFNDPQINLRNAADVVVP